jgi:hypothetical protein
MWIQQDEWIDTLQWQEEEAQMELPTSRIPLEKEGAEVMYSVIAPEPKILAQLLGNISQIMTVAGIDWTMPATDGWDNSNMAMFSGDFEIMGRVERLHWETAARLKVKKIVMGECGHAFKGGLEVPANSHGSRHRVLLRLAGKRTHQDSREIHEARNSTRSMQHSPWFEAGGKTAVCGQRLV